MISKSHIKELKGRIKSDIEHSIWTIIDDSDQSVMAEWLYLLDQRLTELEEEKEMKFLKRRKKRI